MKKAIVFGATGLVGTYLVEELLSQSSKPQVYTVSRSPLRITHPRLTAIILPADRISELDIDLTGADAYSALGTTIKKAGSQASFREIDFNYNLRFAETVKKLGATHFLLVSALGADLKSPFFYSRVKAELEQAIMNLNFDRLTVARPSLLLGDRQEFRWGEKLATLLSPLMFGPFKGIHGRDVARALIKQAQTPSSAKVQVISSGDLCKIAAKP